MSSVEPTASRGRIIFIASVVGLFLELALIRWVSSEIRIFAYFKNLVLVACFLGFGCGCLLFRRKAHLLHAQLLMLLLFLLIQLPWQPLLDFGPRRISRILAGMPGLMVFHAIDPVLTWSGAAGLMFALSWTLVLFVILAAIICHASGGYGPDQVPGSLFGRTGRGRSLHRRLAVSDPGHTACTDSRPPPLGGHHRALLFVHLACASGGRGIQRPCLLARGAFLLVEVHNVSRLALCFGTTWQVNAWVIGVILGVILIANWVSMRMARSSVSAPRWVIAGLFASLAAAYLLPLERFLELPSPLGGFAATLLLTVPIFFAGLLFADAFASSSSPSFALGWNILGAVVGGMAESVSYALGIPSLILVATVFYALAIWWPRPTAALQPDIQVPEEL